LSVVVAAYQVADVIGEALASLRAQTLRPHEVIVCDDGSTDDLAAALEPYRDEIELIRKEHAGEASAQNAAARRAGGDFVVILDADDTWAPQRLEAIAEAATARPDLDIITTDAYLVADGRRLRRCYSSGWTFAADDQRRAILSRNFVFGHPAVRRELLVARGGFDESILWTTDWDCWIRLVLAGARIGCVDEPLATYGVRETSLSARRQDLTRGKISTLRKARAHPGLTAEERDVVDAAVAAHERELAWSEVRSGIAAGDSDGRRRAREIALSPGFRVATRLRAGLLALAPRLAARFIRRDARRSWTGAGGTRVRRRPSP
jgi:glycosyltransferase involved in cell wall biosynthesis